jgi:hypothetical protein
MKRADNTRGNRNVRYEMHILIFAASVIFGV